MVFNATFNNISVLLNDKEFCFSLIGLNSIFLTLPQSEYTLRAGIFGLVSIFVYCLFGVSTLFNQRRDFISSRPIKLQKNFKGQNFASVNQSLTRSV
jgi:hypothetical protein